MRKRRITAVLSACLPLLALLALTACSSDSPSVPQAPSSTESTTRSETETDADTAPITVPSTETLAPESIPETAPEIVLPPPSPEETTSPAETEYQAPSETLPLVDGSYVMGSPDTPLAGANHYILFAENRRHYVNSPFVLYGVYLRQDGTDCLSLGTNLYLPIQFRENTPIPAENSFVKLTAVYRETSSEDRIPYVEAYMAVSAVEILQTPPTEEPLRYVSAEALTVRSAPDSQSVAVGMLYKGDAVRILEAACGDTGEWCKIAVATDAGCGYVKSLYLSDSPP